MEDQRGCKTVNIVLNGEAHQPDKRVGAAVDCPIPAPKVGEFNFHNRQLLIGGGSADPAVAGLAFF